MTPYESARNTARSWAPWRKLAVLVVSLVAVVAALVGVNSVSRSTPTPGNVGVSAVVVNFTYTSLALGVSDPLWVAEWGGLGGNPGNHSVLQLGLTDRSTVNCTLWSLTVYAPFQLISVLVTSRSSPPQLAHPVPLPFLFPAAVGSTWQFALLGVTTVLPPQAGNYAFSATGTASCP